MATSPRRVCWDACTWIALIQDEKIVEGGVDRVTRRRAVIEHAKKGKMEIAMSALCLAEVCKNKDIKDADPQKIADFFEQDYLLLVNVDKDVGERARQFMMAGIPKLKPADACQSRDGCDNTQRCRIAYLRCETSGPQWLDLEGRRCAA